MSKDFFKCEVIETIDASKSSDNSQSHKPFDVKSQQSQGQGKWPDRQQPTAGKSG